MKFSIVTPSFNQEKFIEDTIKSVLKQTYPNFEYIIIDGGSTDGTKEVISKYADSLKMYLSEADEGQADAINKGFKYADGDIYAYLNSDDCYFEDTLEKVAYIFINDPYVDVIYGDCVFTDVDGQFIRYFSEIWDYDRDRLLNISNYVMQPSTFWRRSVFEKFGPFDKRLHYGFDWALWCEFAKNNCNFLRAPAVLSANREYRSTKTSSGGGERLAELKAINNTYKTTLLPGAYFCFAYAELKSTNDNSLWNRLKASFYLLLSYRNVISRMKNCNNNIINGLYPHSGYLRKSARLCLPCQNNYSAIAISLRSPRLPEQVVAVSNRGEPLGCYTFKDGLLEMELDVSDFSGDIDVKMEFGEEYQRKVGFRERLKNPCAPKSVAAELLEFQIR